MTFCGWLIAVTLKTQREKYYSLLTIFNTALSAALQVPSVGYWV
jgi:hypothetical protein